MALVAWDSCSGTRVSCVHRIPASPESLGAVICPKPLYILIFPGSLAISSSPGSSPVCLILTVASHVCGVVPFRCRSSLWCSPPCFFAATQSIIILFWLLVISY